MSIISAGWGKFGQTFSEIVNIEIKCSFISSTERKQFKFLFVKLLSIKKLQDISMLLFILKKKIGKHFLFSFLVYPNVIVKETLQKIVKN